MDPVLATLRGIHTAPSFAAWSKRPWLAYALEFAADGRITDGVADEMADHGFTTTSLTLSNGSGADFPDADWATLDVGTPGMATGDGANDLFQTPAIFADPAHFYWAGRLLGNARPPRTFVAEWYGAISVGSAGESTQSGFGLIEDGGAAGTANDRMAWVGSDGTNIVLTSAGATATTIETLALVTTPLFHRLVLDRVSQLITWHTSANGITWTRRATIAMQADEFPVSFGAFAHTTNRWRLFSTYFYYE